MTGAADHGEPIAGYFAPVHRALTEPILLGGARARSPSSTDAGGRDRAGPALDRRPRDLGDRPCARSGPRGAIPSSSTWPAATSATDMDAAMMSLREYRNGAAPRRLPALGRAGRRSVVLNKDGSFQRTARFRGPDLDSATPAELVATTARLNNALRRLGSGWAIFVEAQRTPALDYPESDFPDPSRRWSIWSGANSFARKARISRATII
jgi:hypothetical protein